MPTANIATPDRLAQIVRPFVGTGRSIHRGDSAIDVLHIMNSVDTSVVAVDASGLTLASDGFARVVPWAEVRSITVRGMADEETTSTVVWENAGAKWPLHSVQGIAA